jgi:glycosyltransferase involved in cell wall biosynthesis
MLGASHFAICFTGSERGIDIAPELLAIANCGCPVMVPRFGCVCEYVNNGETGFVYKDDAELSELLKHILVEHSIDLEQLRANCTLKPKTWEESWKDVFSEQIASVTF